MPDWESILRGWVRPPSDAEDAKRDRTEREIRDALDQYTPIPNAVMRVFVQGSYKNNTNVRLDFDVDIAVEYQEGEPAPTPTPSIANTAKLFKAADLSDEELGFRTLDKPFDPPGYKDHIENALVKAFGRSEVIRRNNCVKVKRGPTTLPADVVPCFPFRRYDSSLDVHRGIRIFPDNGSSIVNYPQQHYDNGCTKNNDTSRRFKRMVRALKRMENDLVKQGRIKEVPSFLVECLVFNVPNPYFGAASYVDDFLAVTEYIWYQTYKAERCEKWVEVNDLKYLFAPSQAWSREDASDLAWQAWQTVKR
jgi:hypothetical protein